MKTTEQIIAIAELDGRLARPDGQIVEYQRYEPQCHPHGVFQRVKFPDGTVSPCYIDEIPDYLTSRDSILRVVEKQPLPLQEKVTRLIRHDLGERLATYTASNWCEALLKATGKWKETTP